MFHHGKLIRRCHVILFCVYMFERVCMFVYMHAYACEGQMEMLGVFLNHPSPYF